MQRQDAIERGVRTETDMLAILTGLRKYGAADLKTADMYEQELPASFQSIADELLAEMQLLQLGADAGRSAIHAAYQHDIGFLNGRRCDFVAFIKAGVRASLIRAKEPGNDHVSGIEQDVKSQWKLVEKAIPSAGHVPLVNFSADHAALGDAELLVHLQTEVRAAVNRLLKLVCLWFDTLVAKEFVGLVEFTSPEAARYHYFRPQVTREVVKKVDETQITVDPTAPFGEQTTYVQSQGEIVRFTTNLERHDHDIVDARADPVEDYPDRMPHRVCEFLKETPTWLRKHLVVVSGTITLERVRRRVVHTEDVGEIVTSVWKGSPAIALGPYAPLGWSSDDLSREPMTFFSEKFAEPARKAARTSAIRWIIAGLAIFCLAAATIWYFVDQSRKADAAAYQAFLDEHVKGHHVVMISTREMVELPGGQPIYYLGKGYVDGSLALTSNPDQAWKAQNRFRFDLPENGPEGDYGTVDLGPVMGIPALMHIINADKDGISFTIEYK